MGRVLNEQMTSVSIAPSAFPLSSKSYDFKPLVHHREFVSSQVRLNDLYDIFKKNNQDFLAVEEAGSILGMCSKIQIGFLLGSRYGFSVMGKKTVRDHMISDPCYIVQGQPLEEALNHALSRSRDRFYEDAVLIDPFGVYLGIIPVPHLVQVQNQLMQQRHDDVETRFQEVSYHLDQLKGLGQKSNFLFENQALGVLFLDLDGRIREINQKMTDLLKEKQSQKIYSKMIVDWVSDKDRSRFERYLQASIQSADTAFEQSQQFEFIVGASQIIYLRIHFCKIPETNEICLFVSDATEQFYMEKSLINREKSAVIESLVCGIAHELNNKLSPIMGLSELLLEESPETRLSNIQVREELRTIYATAQEAGVMIRQLQQLSHPAKPTLQEIDLRSLLDAALRMMRHTLATEGIFLRLEYPSESIFLCVDPAQMKQLLINLILNAVHAMRFSSIKALEIHVIPLSNQVKIDFRDSGEGIQEENIDKVFEPFFTTKKHHEGTGLGLSICQSIIHHHGGEISVQSRFKEGTTFTVTLPRHLSAISGVPPLIKKEKNLDMSFMSQARILVVDDEADICQMVDSMLRSFRVESVMSAHDHERAIDLLKMYSFDWIVSDLRMPHFNGIDLYEWIINNLPRMKNRFILITGESEHSPLSRTSIQWGIPIIRKPFSSRDLAQILIDQYKLEEKQNLQKQS